MKMFINKSTISPYILYGVLELYSNSCTLGSKLAFVILQLILEVLQLF